jgi:hypothetical protein
LVVTPSCAVTTVVIVFAPKFKAKLADAVPDVTAAAAPPFNATVTLAEGSAVVGVTLADVTVPLTLAVKLFVPDTGVSEPVLRDKTLNEALFDPRPTVVI